MFQTLLSKLHYSLILLFAMSVTVPFAYANSANIGLTTALVQDDDDDDRKGRRGRGGKDRNSQRDSDRESRRQQARSDENSRRQQRDSDRESHRQQRRSDDNSRRQQWESDRESRRQQWESDRNSRRQQRYSDRRSDDNYNREYRRSRSERPTIYISPQGNWNQFWNGIDRNGGRRYDREQQRYLKRQQKAAQRGSRYYVPYIQQNLPAYGYDSQYENDVFGSGGGSGLQDMILRTVMASVLGGGGFNLGNIIPGQESFYSSPVNYRSSQYNTYSAPIYDSAGYAYDESGSDTSGGSLLNSLPIAEIIEQFTGGNGFVSELVGNFVSQGYDQGYLAGQSAVDGGYQNAVYNDPYRSENGSCDPYSASVGQNRQYLSQGYELGYRDALGGGTSYDPMTDGNTDLISGLLNNVLSGI